jgi:two-component system cell cycle response regulator
MAKFAHVLVASDNPLDRTRFDSVLAKGDYGCLEASGGAEIAALARKRRPNVALLEGTGDDRRLMAIVSELKDDPVTARIPLMLVVRRSTEALRGRCIELGIDDLVEGPQEDAAILARLRPLARLAVLHAELDDRLATASELGQDIDPPPDVRAVVDDGFRVLIVGPPGAAVDFATAALRDTAELAFEADPYRAMRTVEHDKCDAMVLALAGGDAEKSFYLSSQIRRNPGLFNLPVVLLYEEGVAGDIGRVYRAGVSVALAQPADADLLRTILRLLVARQRRLQNLRVALGVTLTDGICDADTGVYGMAFLRAHLARLIANTRAGETYLSAAVISIRNLADVERAHGKASAKLLMTKVADWIRGMVRIEDLTARLDPATYCTVLPGACFEEAAVVAQRVAAILHQSDFALGEEVMAPIRVDAAAGLTMMQDGDSVDSLLNRAKIATL